MLRWIVIYASKISFKPLLPRIIVIDLFLRETKMIPFSVRT